LTALIAAAVGGVLTLWGARILRAAFVLLFIATGAGFGVQLAEWFDQDYLIGLVLGGFVAGLMGYFMYRWWVGMMTAFVAIAIALSVNGGQLREELQAFSEQHQVAELGTPGSSEYPLGEEATTPADPWLALQGFFSDVQDHFWYQRYEFTRRMLLIVIFAGLAGLGIGLLMPKMTTVVATSLIGTGVILFSVGVWLQVSHPSWWTRMQNNLSVVLVAGLVWAGIGVIYQGRSVMRSKAPPDSPPPAATAA
jgi:hypothetical protein